MSLSRSYDLERVPINLTKVSKARPPAARVLEKLEHDNYLPSLSHIATEDVEVTEEEYEVE
jgi:hypothetical protein